MQHQDHNKPVERDRTVRLHPKEILETYPSDCDADASLMLQLCEYRTDLRGVRQ